LLFALSLSNSCQDVHSLIIDYHLKGCIEEQDLKIALTGSPQKKDCEVHLQLFAKV
jgi:hypothetical protein